MRITTTDPISGIDVTNLDTHPFVIEGEGENALKIFFENEKNKKAYIDIASEYTRPAAKGKNRN